MECGVECGGYKIRNALDSILRVAGIVGGMEVVFTLLPRLLSKHLSPLPRFPAISRLRRGLDMLGNTGDSLASDVSGNGRSMNVTSQLPASISSPPRGNGVCYYCEGNSPGCEACFSKYWGLASFPYHTTWALAAPQVWCPCPTPTPSLGTCAVPGQPPLSI